MWKKIENYSLNFHNKPRKTAIHLKLADSSDAIIENISIEEFNVLGTLLREEVQTWYHTTRGDLIAHSAPLHEEELD